jgi:hypothetical protein
VHHNYSVQVACSPKDRWIDVIRRIEFISNVVYDAETKEFREPVASHSIDQPDEAGRAQAPDVLSLASRQMVVLRVLFTRGGVRGTLDATTLDFGASGSYVQFNAKVPAGVRRRWSITSEREYYDQATDTQSGRVIPTQRRTTEAGVQVDCVSGVLPMGKCRLSGTLVVSSFDEGTAKSGVTVPLDLDGERGGWIKVFTFRTLSAGMTASFRKMGLKLSGGADEIDVYLRVD